MAKRVPHSTSRAGSGRVSLLTALFRERDDLDAAIRILQRFIKTPDDSMHAKATKAAALVEAVNGHEIRLSPNEARMAAALTTIPAKLTDLAKAADLFDAKNKTRPTQRASNVLHSLSQKRVAKRTPQGWVRTA